MKAGEFMNRAKKMLIQEIENGNHVALYCYGIYADYLLSYLKKYHNLLPSLVIDNDARKHGYADFNVPIVSYQEAKKKYRNLKYFICSDDFKYSIIGELIEDGVREVDIINYVPVEKKRGCLYFTNRLLLELTDKNDNIHQISHCPMDSFKSGGLVTKFAPENSRLSQIENSLSRIEEDFRTGKLHCETCEMNQAQYLVRRNYKKRYKQVMFVQYGLDCICHCVYCCVGGGNKNNNFITNHDVLKNYFDFTQNVLSIDFLDDDFSCGIDMTERDFREKIDRITKIFDHVGKEPLVYKINSCYLTYSETMEHLLKEGKAYSIWSVDAGTRETYKKIKQIDAFETVVKNAERYISNDAFGGKFIVPKYLIVKGINDNEKEYDEFLKLIKSLGLQYTSLAYDFFASADEKDIEFIRNCYNKIVMNGLKMAYKNNSGQITDALNMKNSFSQ